MRSAGARSRWLLEARLDAILGGSSRSHKSVRSGIRCWMGFVGKLPVCALLSFGIASGAFLLIDRYDPVRKRYFPPPLELLLPWTTLFRSGGTLRNYLGYVQTGCLMVDVPTHVFQEPALKKAKASVDAAGNFRRRERMFVQRQVHVLGLVPRYVCVCGRHQVEEMLAWCAVNPDQRELCSYALLFLFSYSFLLRGPSEALPAVVGGHGHVACTNSMLSIEGDQLVLILKRRKNKPEGSRLARNCSCRKSAASCVYCRLKPLVDAVPQGQRIFPGLTAAGAIVVLAAA